MSVLFSMMRMIGEVPEKELAAQSEQALRKRLEEDWLLDRPQLHPDSREAAEVGEVGRRTRLRAQTTWERMKKPLRAKIGQMLAGMGHSRRSLTREMDLDLR